MQNIALFSGKIANFESKRKCLSWTWMLCWLLASCRSIQVKLFSHLHGLSLRWHLNRKTGEVLRVMDRGTNSVNTILQYIVFSILPTIADIVIAVVYFLTFFNAWFALIVFITMAVYMSESCLFVHLRLFYYLSYPVELFSLVVSCSLFNYIALQLYSSSC